MSERRGIPAGAAWRRFLPWALAACCGFGAAWFARLHVSSRAEAQMLRDTIALGEITLAGTRQQLEAERILAKQQLRMLAAGSPGSTNLAKLEIVVLVPAPVSSHSSSALGVALWDQAKQEGVLAIEKFAGLADDETLELWIVEEKDGAAPVSAGVFELDAHGTARVRFRTNAAIGAINSFVVSREKRDGERAHAKPNQVILSGRSR